MTGRQLDAALALLLCAAAGTARARLSRRMRARRRTGAVLAGPSGAGAARVAGGAGGAGSEGGPDGRPARIAVPRLRAPASPLRARPGWLVPELLLLPGGLLVGALLLGSPVPLVAAGLSVLPLHRWRVRRSAIREERGRAAAVIELCAAVAGELRSGATPEQALETVTGRGRSAAGVLDRLGPEALARLAAGGYGADVPSGLRRLAGLPGGGGAAAIAACWQVTTDSGAGLARGLDQVAEALRADHALREEIRSELAGPRTTAVLLAALPALGLVLGSALGAEPLRVLLRTPTGLGCLVAGLLLEAAGLLWTGRIVRGAQADLGVNAGTTVRERRGAEGYGGTAAHAGHAAPGVRDSSAAPLRAGGGPGHAAGRRGRRPRCRVRSADARLPGCGRQLGRAGRGGRHRAGAGAVDPREVRG